ncbi:MAG: hypothetical protein RR338_00610 [Clostridia bacterium]
MKSKEIIQILAKYFKEKENYDDEISATALKKFENREYFRVETVGNDFEICAYNDGTIFIRLGGMVGGWKTLDGQPALIVDDIPFLPFS